jgi:hypothetical protein
MRDDVRPDAEQTRDPDDLDAEVVEDLDVDDDAERVEGGTVVNTGGCPVN